MTTGGSTGLTPAALEASLAFTQRKLDDAWEAFDANGGQATDPTEEAPVIGMTYYTFKCPACPERVEIIPRTPWRGETPGPLGFVDMKHAEPFACLAKKHAHNLTNAMITAKKVRELQKEAAGLDLESVRLKRLLAGGEGVKWLIPGVMERGKLVGLFGPPKTGKSLLALQWAVELAQGGQRVVYLDEENDPDEVDARLEDMGVDPADLTGRLTFYSFTNWTVDTEEGAAKIMEACRGADLVVFDSWAKFFATGSQSDDAAINRAYRLVLKPLRAARVGVIRLDHTGHAETLRPSGSVQKLADVDHNWLMRAKKVGRGEPVPVTLTHTENRTGRGEDVISLVREVSPVLRHVAPAGQEDAPEEITGTTEDDRLAAVVEALDDLSAPTDWTVKVAQAALRKAGKGARTALISEALKIRRREPTPAA